MWTAPSHVIRHNDHPMALSMPGAGAVHHIKPRGYSGSHSGRAKRAPGPNSPNVLIVGPRLALATARKRAGRLAGMTALAEDEPIGHNCRYITSPSAYTPAIAAQVGEGGRHDHTSHIYEGKL